MRLMRDFTKNTGLEKPKVLGTIKTLRRWHGGARKLVSGFQKWSTVSRLTVDEMEKRSMSEETWITRAECARRLELSKTMITRYVVRGMPSDPQGRVPWPGAREWVANNIHPSMSGNWVHRQATKLGSPKKINLADPYTRGVVDGFRRARHNIREELPEVLGTAMGLNGGERTFYLAILDYLTDQWLDAGPDDKLPPIDWSVFREEAPELEKYFIEIQESLAAGKEI